ncbi:MAG TPA: patatin-like phospholipase family protein [Anaeromyxobacter sp.]|nr:patatin-like phospholipase family protein [Anaeromyxobacter sp.]
MTAEDEVDALKEAQRPFEEAEAALVRSVVSTPAWLKEPDECALRYALNLARLSKVRTSDGGDLDLGPAILPFREDVRTALPAFTSPTGLDRPAVSRLAAALLPRALLCRDRAVALSGGRLGRAALDREVCEKALVVVCGGGGGVAYSYLGAFQLLDRYGLSPRLLAGTSMGAALALFRARRPRWHAAEMDRVLSKLTFRTLFRFLEGESRYGLPAAMRLYLRAAIGELMRGPDGHPLTLGELAVPLLVAVTGVRKGALPRDPSYYEHLLDLSDREDKSPVLSRVTSDVLKALGELLAQRDRLVPLYLGADPETRDFDAIDAVGFSSALPGVIHYDVLREDERMHALLDRLFLREDLFRLVDGGLVDNLPARAAWAAVEGGQIGSRNAFVLALEGFAPKLTQPLWYGLEQLAAASVAFNRPFIHLHRSFQRVLSPADIVPDALELKRAVNDGKAELHPDLPFLAHMVRKFAAPRG